MKEIKLSGRVATENNLTAIVDDSDFELVSKFKWHAVKSRNTFYAKTNMKRKNHIQKKVYLHRMILGLTDSQFKTDHKNGNGLDCQRLNIRLCTTQENAFNMQKVPGKSSKYKGVTFDKSRNKFLASICLNGKLIKLGIFTSEIEAAKVYNNKAVELFGDFCRKNILEIS
jgi:hypothetical protein